MKKSFRLAIEQPAAGIVAPHLRRSGIKATEYTAHKDGSCTVGANEPLKNAIRSTTGVEVLKEGAESITFRSNAMADYTYLNPPLYTEAEKAQMEAEKLARKANRVKRNSRLELLDDADGDDSDYEEVDADSDEE
jgi:hypothetical protein